MLLATATPVQLRPIEAWDLLDVLSRGSDAVLGGMWSKWKRAEQALNLVTRQIDPPDDDLERWEWVRTPLPPRQEHRDFELIRRSLQIDDSKVTASGSDWDRLRPPDQSRVRQLFPRFFTDHNPFIRHIVRRSRKYLEDTIDPETNEPFLKPIRVDLFGEDDDDAIKLSPYLKEAYETAEAFCRELGARVRGAGFLRTLLLRRVGSTIAAGKATAQQMLNSWRDLDKVQLEREADDASDEPRAVQSKSLTESERHLLEKFVKALEANTERDPKYAVVLECLRNRSWLNRGCIIFSQYYDSVRWLAEQLINDFPNEPIAIYAGSGRSGVYRNGRFQSCDREVIKADVRSGALRLLLGTDAASEGLNLQRLGTLINLDLPWNPTRLEQRKGRIQRIGQNNDVVLIYNMRYLGSVEDRVHQLLSSRLQGIFTLFGQVPDVLEDVWIDLAMGEEEHAKKVIDAVPQKHPFEVRYNAVFPVNWETCERVLARTAKDEILRAGW